MTHKRVIHSTLSGFTPAPDVLIKEYDFVTALVWGRVWRYCQMIDGVCTASLDKIAGELNMSTRTIMRHIVTLEKGSYLKDMTPDLRNKPHTYADTGKIRIGISIETTVTESHTPAVTESHLKNDEDDVNLSQISKTYEAEVGIITTMVADNLRDASVTYPAKWIVDAIREAVKHNARSWAYIETILKRWKAQGNQEPANKNAAAQNTPDRPEYRPYQPKDGGHFVPNPNPRPAILSR